VIVAVPGLPPVTKPVEALTEAMVASLLDHVPPGIVLIRAVDCPEHTESVPVIGPGAAFTVATAVVKQPVGSVYVIVDVPGATPNKAPFAEPIVAMPVVLLAHVPPPVVLVSVEVAPTHTDRTPPMFGGSALTVTIRTAAQPEGGVYVIVVVPGVTPHATPEASIVPIAVLLLAHVPPVIALVSEVQEPTHMLGVPAIGAAGVFTVITAVMRQPVVASV
jgi:hypothetical protein